MADLYTRTAAEPGTPDRRDRKAAAWIHSAFLKHRTTERATRRWQQDLEKRNTGRRTFRLPTPVSRPGATQQLRGVPKRIASRYFLLKSDYAVTTLFHMDRWKWTNSNACWWYEKGRQSRQHLFKECTVWTKEIRELWRGISEEKRPGAGREVDESARVRVRGQAGESPTQQHQCQGPNGR